MEAPGLVCAGRGFSVGGVHGTKAGRFYRHCHREQGEASPRVNELLTEYGDIIVGRMGIPYHEREVSVIALIVDGTTNAIGALTGKLGMIEGVTVKSAMSKGSDKGAA